MEFDWSGVTKPVLKNEKGLLAENVKAIAKLCEGDDASETEKNKVICIIGDRGCGKTSLLRSVMKELKSKEENGNVADFYVTDLIDPSIFDDSLSISEFFISVLANEIKKEIPDDCRSGWNSERNTNRLNFDNKLIEIMDVIADLKSNKERFYEEHHAADIVSSIQNRSKFKHLLHEFIEVFYAVKGYSKNTKMVVCIDDLDLVKNKHIYQMIEDIQKCLNGNCIVLLAFREIQLLNAIQDHLIAQNTRLLEKNILSMAEIKDQSLQFYEKQFPVSRRFYLRGQKEFFSESPATVLRPFFKDTASEIEFSEKLKNDFPDMDLHGFMSKLVRDKLALPLDPIDEKEKVHLIYPNGLREILAFIRMMMEMKDIRNNDELLKNNLKENLKTYRNYVLYRAKVNLNIQYFSILEEWLKTSVKNKNYYVCSKIDGLLKNAFKGQDGSTKENQFLAIESVQSYNVTVGDVIRFLNELKSRYAFDEGVMYFCYLIKILYSIELLTAYLDLKAEDLNKNVDAPTDDDDGNLEEGEEDEDATRESDEFCLPDTPYSELINCTFMPDGFKYVSARCSSNAVNYISILNDKDELEEEEEEEEEVVVVVEEREEEKKKLCKLADQIAYSRIMGKSQIWNEARPKSSGAGGFYRFRPLYHDQIFLPSEMEKKNKINYRADPFSAVLKKNYLRMAEENKAYVFYSLFDVDAFMRITFYNKKKKGYREYIYRKINRFLCNKTDGNPHPLYEEELRLSISHLYPVNIPVKDVFSDDVIQAIYSLETEEIALNKENTSEEQISDNTKKFIKRLLKQNINVWREWAEIICELPELTAAEKTRAQKLRDNLNLKNRRRLWKSDIDDFTYFLEKYPKLADMLR